jgi:hypothetical protein
VLLNSRDCFVSYSGLREKKKKKKKTMTREDGGEALRLRLLPLDNKEEKNKRKF